MSLVVQPFVLLLAFVTRHTRIPLMHVLGSLLPSCWFKLAHKVSLRSSSLVLYRYRQLVPLQVLFPTRFSTPPSRTHSIQHLVSKPSQSTSNASSRFSRTELVFHHSTSITLRRPALACSPAPLSLFFLRRPSQCRVSTTPCQRRCRRPSLSDGFGARSIQLRNLVLAIADLT